MSFLLEDFYKVAGIALGYILLEFFKLLNKRKKAALASRKRNKGGLNQ